MIAITTFEGEELLVACFWLLIYTAVLAAVVGIPLTVALAVKRLNAGEGLIPTFLSRRRTRIRNGRCPECGYDLRHRFETGCSECGWKRYSSQ